MKKTPYIGRFAPSPSGPLHFGSLIAALGSYLQAKANNGLWKVRIEDIDPPREIAGSASAILTTLDAYGLHWDGIVLYQHTRVAIYQEKIDQLLKQGLAYYCQCTRKKIKQEGENYLCPCQNYHYRKDESAIRVKIDKPVLSFFDLKHKEIQLDSQAAKNNIIIKRKDGLFAYNLAVVLDDIFQNITQVVRGADLIEPTGAQIALYQILNKTPPSYLHLPLALDDDGYKLSKQNRATAIDNTNPSQTLEAALAFLGHPIPSEIRRAPVQELLDWAIGSWTINQLPEQREMRIRC